MVLLCTLLGYYSINAQNPNWTLPSKNFDLDVDVVLPLPTSPTDPNSGNPDTDPSNAYQGALAEHVHGAYTDPSGDILFFTVDEKVYDKNGWVVGDLKTGFTKKGWNERLILPMGNDCRRFAIIYPASAATTESYGSTDDRMRIYMTVYNLDGTNAYMPYATGDLEGQSGAGVGSTLTDITDRECQAESANYPGIYGCQGVGNPVPQSNYRGNYQIAATELIDNCFYYVYIFDGRYLMRYKLTTNDLEWDDYVVEIPQATSNTGDQRTEMELIKLSNGDFRIAIPTYNNDGTYISMYDIDNSNYELDISSHQQIDLSYDTSNNSAEMIGLEFDQSGRYLYFTHENNSTPQWQTSILDVYDFNTSSIVTSLLPSLTNIGDYQFSFIERYGNTLYLASDDDLATLEVSDDPVNAVWTTNVQSISSGYKNRGGESFIGFERSILPEQLDMAYPDLASFSCECCRDNTPETVDRYTATTNAVWTQSSNPFGTSQDVYITNELEIAPGVDIVIDNMNFYFGEDARVLVRREANNETGAFLHLRNGTVFTADNRCPDQSFVACGTALDCDRKRWQGIVVEGDGTTSTQNWNGSTPHARLLVDGQSMIEHAITGARAGNQDITAGFGGMIRMFDATVKDCIQGVYFDAYTRLSGTGTQLYTNSFIDLTEFKTTLDWIDSDDEVPDAFVTVIYSSGIKLRGNQYENETPTAFSLVDRGIGVYTERSRVESSWKCTSTSLPCPAGNVVRSTYTNLYEGVHGQNSGMTSRTYYEFYSEFSGNYRGIYLNNFVGPKLYDNDIHVAPLTDAVGIYLLISSGYAVENNSFDTYQGTFSNRNIGIVVDNSGDGYNEIYNNYFTDLTIGGYTVGDNVTELDANGNVVNEVGLDWLCNTFEAPIAQADIYLDGSMSDEQGFISSPAGNIFSHSSSSPVTAGHDDLYSSALSILNIEYYHHAPVPAELEPLSCYGCSIIPPQTAQRFYRVNTGLSYSKTSCPIKGTGLPESLQEKSDGEAYTMASVQAVAGALEESIEEASALLDCGQTVEILELLSAGADQTDMALDLIDGCDTDLSSDVVTAMLNHESDALQSLAIDMMTESLNGAGTSYDYFAQSEAEQNLKLLKREYNLLWRDVSSFYQSDTTGSISEGEMEELLDTYRPTATPRLASILLGETANEWLPMASQSNSVVDVALPAMSNDTLPRFIPEYFEGDFFHTVSNANALNTHYANHHAKYFPTLQSPEWIEMEEIADDGKSKGESILSSHLGDPVFSPNPFSHNLTLDLTNMDVKESQVQLILFDLMGKKVFDAQFTQGEEIVVLPGGNLPRGFITYQIWVDGEVTHTGKLVHQ